MGKRRALEGIAWRYEPEEYLLPGVRGHPSIFESVVDLFRHGKADSKTFLNKPTR